MNFNENADLIAYLTTADAAAEAAEALYFPMDLGDDRDEAREDQRFVSYQDVDNADVALVWGFGGDHRVYIPAAHE